MMKDDIRSKIAVKIVKATTRDRADLQVNRECRDRSSGLIARVSLSSCTLGLYHQDFRQSAQT